MWKFVTRGIRESLERRACRTNVYSQSPQDANENNEHPTNITPVCNQKFLTPNFSAFYRGYYRNGKYLGPKDEERNRKYDAKYSWSDAVSWSSFLAVGYVVCQSLCIRRKLFELDNSNLEKWRNKLLLQPQIQASRLLSHILLPRYNYILPISQEPIKANEASETLGNNAASIDQVYGPLTAEQTLKQAADEFLVSHNEIMGEIELDYGSKAIEEKRYEDAIEHFTTGAELASAGSMFNLGLCYELGLGTSIDYSQAMEYYKKAADKGHADAMYNLGVFHAQGRGGIKTDLNIARQLFTEAANKGQTQALQALQLERSFKKKSNLNNKTKYSLEVKPVNSNKTDGAVVKLLSYTNILMSSIKDQRSIESEQYINSFNNANMTNSTDMFLDMLGIRETSAIPLISVGESGP